MTAVDTQILVFAMRKDSPHHTAAYAAVQKLAESSAAWAIPWPCIHEAINVVTNRRIYQPATKMPRAFEQIRALLTSPSIRLLAEGPDHLDRIESLLALTPKVGPIVHDARIAAICLGAGVRELWTADRDFSHFPALRCRNPLQV